MTAWETMQVRANYLDPTPWANRDRAELEFDEWMADLLHRFIDQHAYNGAPGKGQAIYNEGGNPWLHDQVSAYLERECGSSEHE